MRLTSKQQQSDKIHGIVTVYYFDVDTILESYCILNNKGEFVDGTFYVNTPMQREQMKLIKAI